MYSTFEVGLIAVIALCAGLAVGYLLLRRLGPRGSTAHEELRQLREEQQHYRHQVTQHFSTTAEMLGQLANSYREIHSHLAHGAQTLCDAEAAQAIKSLSSDDLVSSDQQQPLMVEPPRDYAVQGDPYDSGDDDPNDPRFARSEPPRY